MSEGSHIIDRDDPSAPAPLIAAAKALRRLAPSYNKFYIVGVEDARALTEAGALDEPRDGWAARLQRRADAAATDAAATAAGSG